jgi:Tol biopolymer transport system component
VSPDLDEAPPRPAHQLLDHVLRRGHELRQVARRQRQITWLGRTAAVLAVAGLAAGLTHGGTAADGPGRGTLELVSPEGEESTSTAPAAPAGGRAPGGPSTTGGAAPEATTTTGAPSAAEQRVAPLAVVEQRGQDGWYRTAVLDRDGSLAPVTAATAERQMPALSPQGDAIAFQGLAPHPLTGQLRWELFTVGTDGNGLRQVTGGVLEGGPRLVASPLGAGSRWPSWSPDGRRLAYSCSGATGLPVICVSDADGTDRRRITEEGDGFYQPTWSPDGHTIAAKREVDAGEVELWLLDTEGGGAVELPVPRVDPRGVRLSWSVDGTELVYAQVDGGPPGLVVVDVATGQRRLVPTAAPARFPVACGVKQILYLQTDTGLDDDRLRTGPLVLVGSDGSDPTTVVPAGAGVEHLPSSCAAR